MVLKPFGGRRGGRCRSRPFARRGYKSRTRPASLVESLDQVALGVVALANVTDELVERVPLLQAREQRASLLEPLDGSGVGVVVARTDRRLDLGQVHLERVGGMLALARACERQPQAS